MIQKATIKKICQERNLIIELKKYISDLSDNKKSSSFMTGTCPFCGSKTFTVDKDRQLFKCFADNCFKQGNVIDFIAAKTGMTFYQTVAKLGGKFETEEEKDVLKKERLLDINRIAANYYINQFQKPLKSLAKQYIYNKRKLTNDTIANFGIGFAPGGKSLYTELSKSFSDEELLESGLFTERNGQLLSFLWNRVVFPITDEWNNIISFGGRVLDDSKPKYLNGSDSLIFNKKFHLFGLGQALANAPDRKLDHIIVCEGYMDVISMHQAGFTETVASLGTALTPFQCRLISKHTDVVYTAYDSDDAGKKATQRAISLLSETGVEVKVLNLFPYKDPDEFIKEIGKDSLEKRISLAVTGKKWLLSEKVYS